jgi:uncharacterized protein (DUF697 family)
MALPVNPRDLMKMGGQLTAEGEKPLRFAVAVEDDAPDALLVALEDALRPRTPRAQIAVGVPGVDEPVLTNETDVLIVLVGSGSQAIVDVLAEAHRRTFPSVALALRPASTATAHGLRQPLDDFVSGEDAASLVRDDLASRLTEHLSDKRLALAANFDFLRPAVANEYVKATSWQNALIGGVTIIPGADMPLMTGNQAKMVLQIAAAYGQRLDSERLKELVAVVGGGFALRAVARQLLDFIPGFGWALKAGVGYSGTLAMGKAAIAYFEQGADFGGVLHRLSAGATDVRDRVRAGVARKREHELPSPSAEDVYTPVPQAIVSPAPSSDEGARD